MTLRPSNSAFDKREQKRDLWQVVFVIVAGLLIGVCGGTLFLKLRAQGFSFSPEMANGPTTGPSVDDAAEEIDQLQHAFVDLVEKKSPASGLVSSGEDIANRYPNNDAAQMLFGQILLNDHQYQAAYSQMIKSLAIRPHQPEVELLAGTIAHDLKQDNLAEIHYRNAVQLDPANPRIRMHLAQLYFDRKDYNVAASIALDILQRDSSSHQACAMLADILVEKGDIRHAIETFQTAIEKTPAKDHELRSIYIRKKAALHRRLNEPTLSLQALRQLDPKETTTTEVIEEIAQSWALLGRPEQAAEVYDDAAALNPTNWQFSAGAARWYINAGDKPNAQRHIQLIRQYNKKLPVIAELEDQINKMVASPTTAPVPGPAVTRP